MLRNSLVATAIILFGAVFSGGFLFLDQAHDRVTLRPNLVLEAQSGNVNQICTAGLACTNKIGWSCTVYTGPVCNGIKMPQCPG